MLKYSGDDDNDDDGDDDASDNANKDYIVDNYVSASS